MGHRQFSLRGLLLAVGFAAIYFAVIGLGLRGADPAAAVISLATGHAAIGLPTVFHYIQRKWALRKSAPHYLDLPMHFPRWFFAQFAVILFACVVLVEFGRLPSMILLVAAPWTMGIYILFLPDRVASLCRGGVVFMSNVYPWDRIHPLRNAYGELEFLRFGKMRGAWRAIVPPAQREPVEAILRCHVPRASINDSDEQSSAPAGAAR